MKFVHIVILIPAPPSAKKGHFNQAVEAPLLLSNIIYIAEGMLSSYTDTAPTAHCLTLRISGISPMSDPPRDFGCPPSNSSTGKSIMNSIDTLFSFRSLRSNLCLRSQFHSANLHRNLLDLSCRDTRTYC